MSPLMREVAVAPGLSCGVGPKVAAVPGVSGASMPRRRYWWWRSWSRPFVAWGPSLVTVRRYTAAVSGSRRANGCWPAPPRAARHGIGPLCSVGSSSRSRGRRYPRQPGL